MNSEAEELLLRLIDALEKLSLLDGDETCASLKTPFGICGILTNVTMSTSPYILIKDDRKVLSVGPPMLQLLVDELALQNRLQAGKHLESRVLNLLSELKSFDHIAKKKIENASDTLAEYVSLADMIGDRLCTAFSEMQQTASDIAHFARKLSMFDPIEDSLSKSPKLQKLYKLLRERGQRGATIAELETTAETNAENCKRYIRKLNKETLSFFNVVIDETEGVFRLKKV